MLCGPNLSAVTDMRDRLKELLDERPWLLADGATGSNLFDRGLQSGDAPIKGMFSWGCITGELDRNKGHWFGLITTMTFWATESMNRTGQ